ncbi:cytochrome c [Mucilaginibacter sp. AK015]|uniref:c-type cytochrome n=1 Tax=Mucilaginibacter sp. AK015 TaxID=2723072 RepID=UPI001611C661|nr:cytochrome c [Mucilaginibacter sp. AK015]MBB5397701.1 mono/diheme cytochrome c family protein [Mucilaginibacter sp. AK015]
MKKFKKWATYIAICVALFIIAAISYVSLALPNVGEPQNIKVDATPQRIARGKYLANHVAVCIDCHSTRKWDIFAAPIDTAVIGAGGEKFDSRISFPGEVYVPNITPANLKSWTDGELYRAITTGVKKDGSAIFPIMPWQSYSKMDPEDVYDIIAYIRTLQPHAASYPKRKLDFPLNLLVNTMPKKAEPGKRPAESDTLKYGAYLVTTAACAECHTKAEKGSPIPGMEFAGGNEYGMGNGATLRAANISPDKETGIGSWTKEQFISRFKQFDNSAMKPVAVKPGEFQTIMPWWRYSGMSETDLGAIYAYLKTVKPVKNKVNKFQVDATASINPK